MKIVAWNIWAGGGKRIFEIDQQLQRWEPDLVVFSEYRGTPASLELASLIKEWGLVHQLASTDPRSPATNSLLIASRCLLRPIRVRSSLASSLRWLLAEVHSSPPFTLGAMHVPNYVSGKKQPFHDEVIEVASKWKRGKGLLIGDTNSGLPGIDEETAVFSNNEKNWIESLDNMGWVDAFRKLHGNQIIYTWYSPNKGNGFRLDQAFVNRPLQRYLSKMKYQWGKPVGSKKRNSLSDHAAILLELDGVVVPFNSF